MRAVLDKHEQTYHRVWEENRRVVRYLRQADAPIPAVLRITASHVLENQILTELRRAADAAVLPDRVFEVSEDAHSLGLELDLSAARPIISRTVACALDALTERPTAERAATVVRLYWPNGWVFVSALAHAEPPRAWRDHPGAREWLRPLAVTLGFALATDETR
jgi:hypothetical protein